MCVRGEWISGRIYGSYCVGCVDHSFGKVLGLATGATQLHKLWRDNDAQMAYKSKHN